MTKQHNPGFILNQQGNIETIELETKLKGIQSYNHTRISGPDGPLILVFYAFD